jgi:hypothetical protein
MEIIRKTGRNEYLVIISLDELALLNPHHEVVERQRVESEIRKYAKELSAFLKKNGCPDRVAGAWLRAVWNMGQKERAQIFGIEGKDKLMPIEDWVGIAHLRRRSLLSCRGIGVVAWNELMAAIERWNGYEG